MVETVIDDILSKNDNKYGRTSKRKKKEKDNDKKNNTILLDHDNVLDQLDLLFIII